MAEDHMHAAPDSIEALLLRLPAQDRARIADLLLASLDEEADSDVDAAWAEEAERRLAELRAGTVAAIPSEDVHARIQDALRRGAQRED
jgi:putative addiction module component (TIGR02574 family)